MRRPATRTLTALALALALAPASLAAAQSPHGPNPPTLELKSVESAGGVAMLVGSYAVYENRAAMSGRQIHLDVVVLPATGEHPQPDPIVMVAGGPGEAVTTGAAWNAGLPLRRERDLVFIDQRGTNGDHRLDCPLPGSDDNLQGYLDDDFDPAIYRACLDDLGRRYDLTQYSTANAADDLADVLAALGYERVNLIGGSYGTRASLVFMRQHPEMVRTATLIGIAPIEFTNPLYHAEGAQRAIEMIFDRCAADPACREAFCDLPREFEEILARLEEAPAATHVIHPKTGERVEVMLSRHAFAEAVRIMMYQAHTAAALPSLIHAAHAGDFHPFAQRGLETNRGIIDALAFGMLMCVTCSEDLDRIDPDTIERLTAGSFMGDHRVRQQLAACAFWPRSTLPEGFGAPVHSEAPTLIISGIEDPVTPPKWGEIAARNLPNSHHLVLNGAHGAINPCVFGVVQAFLAAGSVEALDASCAANVKFPPFQVPREGDQ